MTNEFNSGTSVEQAEVKDLLDRRSVIQGWLDRLHFQEGSVSERVLHRVREDYENRLQEVLNALATHRRLVQEELDRSTRRLDEAEQEYLAALDELEEGRLRNMIGEIEDATWADRSQLLDEAARAAKERHETAQAESSRLRDLLHQLDERTVDVPASPPHVPLMEDEEVGGILTAPILGEAGDLDPDDEEEDDEGFTAIDAENETFLEQIDRALTDLPANVLADDGEENGEDTAPKPGLKCGECGYTNDLSAWFCGVCGADVG